MSDCERREDVCVKWLIVLTMDETFEMAKVYVVLLREAYMQLGWKLL